MKMIMIPISVAYFILGYILGIATIIVLSIWLTHKQEKRKKEFADKLFKSLEESKELVKKSDGE